MADRKTVTIRQPAIPGWSSGQPRYEANATQTQRVKTGSSGAPGVYDEIEQQWYRVAANLAKGRAFVEQLEIETHPCGWSPETPDGDESPDETRWNDALADLVLGGRLGVEGADGQTWGAGAWLSQVHDVVWYGFGVWDPYWIDTGAGAGVDLASARLVLAPLNRAACYQWIADAQTYRLMQLRYLGASVSDTIDADDLIHITHGGGPGEYFGRGELRPVVGLFHAWRESLVSNASSNRASRGRLMVTEPELLDDDSKARINALVAAFDDGRVDSFSMPFGAAAEIAYPSGSPPDYSALRAELDQSVDYLFDSRNSSLVIFGSGSRAVAETMGAEDAESRLSRWDRDVNRAYQRLAQWIARQTGYTGRIRTAGPVGAESAQIGDLAGIIERGITSGALTWTAADQRWYREQVGLPEPDESAAQVTGLDQTPQAQTDALTLQPFGEGCGCGSCGATMSDDPEPAGVTGADGVHVEHYRGPISIELDGETITPETVVAWASDEDDRQRLDAELSARLAPIIDEHRAAVWDALRSGYDRDRQADVYDTFRDRYAAAVTGYLDQIKAQVREQRTAERDRQSSRTTSREGLAVDALREWARGLLGRAVAHVDIIAETIASRVQSPVESAWAGGGNDARQSFNPRQTSAGLAREARPVANQIESVGAVVEATEGAEPGMVVIAAVRSSMKDGNVCKVCRASDADGRTFRFPEDNAEFDEYVNEHGPPDKSCLGGRGKCRCRWVLVWGRQE